MVMGLFDKKYCDVCGERIRFLGNKKLEDGNLCKGCESKLSPWFSDRRRSTVEEIKAQLAYREENKQRAAAFAATVSYGEGNVVLIDENKQQFVIKRAGESMSDNPDVLALSDVTGCDVSVEHSQLEEKTKDDQGKPISYNPPRRTHSYRFFLTVRVNHPYFDEMRFRVNRGNVEIKTGYPSADAPALSAQIAGALTGMNLKAPVSLEPDTENSADYQKYFALANAMRRALLRLPEPAKETPAPAEKAACPCCGAPALPDANGRCPYCGESMRG